MVKWKCPTQKTLILPNYKLQKDETVVVHEIITCIKIFTVFRLTERFHNLFPNSPPPPLITRNIYRILKLPGSWTLEIGFATY